MLRINGWSGNQTRLPLQGNRAMWGIEISDASFRTIASSFLDALSPSW